MARPPRRGGRTNLGLFLLFGQIMQIGINNIPPITIITVAINALIYLNLFPSLPNAYGACTSNHLVFQRKEWWRLFYSSFYHLDDMHLYFNMISFISKGMALERKLKSRKFLFLIASFSVFTQIVMLAINHLFAEMLHSDYYLVTCAAGFSAVCFALKVVASVNSSGTTYLTGIPMPVPLRHAHWFELVLIQILVPNASFTGHLAGIVVGLMYTHGPLEKIIKVFNDFFFKGTNHSMSYQHQSERSGYRSSGLTDDELLQEGIRESLRTNRFQPYPVGNNRSFNDTDDENLQEAIRQSLNTNSKERQQQQQPPGYGWNIPTDYLSGANSENYKGHHSKSGNSLYPDLSKVHNENMASAPPYPVEEFSGRSDFHPVDQSHTPLSPPYPVRDISGRPSLRSANENNLVHRHKSSNADDNTMDQDAMREARVKRFATNH